MKLTTTLNEISKHDPCGDGWKKLIAFLGDDYDRDAEINLLTILESNGVSDCLWALRATSQNSKKISVQLAVEFASGVLHIFENEHPNDDRPRKAIDAARTWIEEPTQANVDAAKTAAYGAHAAAAYIAAHADYAAHAGYAGYAAAYGANAAYAAAYAAYVAYVAADAAGYAANAGYAAANAAHAADANLERQKQADIIRQYLVD